MPMGKRKYAGIFALHVMPVAGNKRRYIQPGGQDSTLRSHDKRWFDRRPHQFQKPVIFTQRGDKRR